MRAGFAGGLVLLLISAVAAASAAATAEQHVVDKGLRIDFTVVPDARGVAATGEDGSLVEGEFAEVRFRVTDAETGAPVSPLQPAVWISRDGKDELSCRERIGRYLQGMLSYQAEVDLNKYFLLILNNDQSISVVDPLLGVDGVTQLYAMIVLEEPGEDWSRSADDSRMFVSMPKAGRLAVVDLERFRVVENVEVGERPVKVATAPDGRTVWVGDDGPEGQVHVVDTASLEVRARLRTGPGHHEIAFSEDGLRAFVTHRAGVTVFAVDRLERVRDIVLDAPPVAVATSALSGRTYVADAAGTITVLDGDGAVADRIPIGAPIREFALDTSGRWALAIRGATNDVDVIDTSRGAVVQRLAVAAGAHQLAFTETYAYVRHLDTAEVTLIPLAQLGRPQAPALQRVALGSKAPGEYAYPATASAISPTGEWTSVMAANPADQKVYYYMEGMIAPMGSYSTYGRIPRAVSVVDRSVRETAPGTYTGRFRVPRGGDYSVAFLVDSPWVDHCFEFAAEADPSRAATVAARPSLEYRHAARVVESGEPMALHFALDAAEPVPGPVVVLATRPPGHWRQQVRAERLPDGTYRANVHPDAPGAYYVSVAIPALGVDFAALPYTTFRAVRTQPEESPQ